jgi:hypothetical protein
MKKFPTSLLLAGALLFPAVLSAAGFEGKVTMTMKSSKGSSSKEEPLVLTYEIKDGMTRIDMPSSKSSKNGGSGAMIIDTSKQEMTILADSGDKKIYFVRPMPKPQERVEENAKRNDVSFEKTGDTTTILGYTCEKYVVKGKDGSSDIWVTDQLGTFMGMSAGSNPMARRSAAPDQQPWEKALAGKNFFPMRVDVYDKNTKETFHMEVTSIEKQSLPDSLFKPGPEYSEFKMPSVGDMMRGLIPGSR